MAKNAAAAVHWSTRRAQSAAEIRVEAHANDDQAATAPISTLSASEVIQYTSAATAIATNPGLPAAPLKNNFVGVHVSASGGADRAVANSLALGPLARSLALFVRPRLSWKPVPPLSDTTITKFHDLLSDTKAQQIRLDKVVVHGSYLINLGSHDASLREKSVELMAEEVRKCAQLGVSLYVFHPGSCTGSELTQRRKLADAQSRANQKVKVRTFKKQKTTEAGGQETQSDNSSIGNPSEDVDESQVRRQSITFVAESMVKVLKQTENVTLVVENMSSQGNVLGSSFCELRAVLDAVLELASQQQPQDHQEPKPENERRATQERLGVCLDTCHAFASGYDLSTTENCEQMMRDFDECMLPQWPNALKVVHLNDSKAKCGSKLDRHANIGHGEIGLDAFRWIMNSARFEGIPLILETPRAKTKKAKKGGNMQKLSDSEDENGEFGSAKGKKKRARGKMKSDDENMRIPSATEELEFLYSLVE